MISARLTKPVPLVTLLVMLGLIAVSAAPVVWHWQGDFAAPAALQDRSTPALAATTLPSADIDPILALAAFGTPPEAAVDAAPIGETTLELTLLGVVLRSEPAQSRALIANAGTSGQYGPGDTIADRAKLVEVATDHVILDVEGTLQTLSFPTPKTADPAQVPVLTGTERLTAAIAAQSEPAEPETTQDYIDL